MRPYDSVKKIRTHIGFLIILVCLMTGSCANRYVNPFLRGFETNDFEPDGPLNVFNEGTLFQFMNGEAETYISAGFQLLYVQTYMNPRTGGLITIESYDMGSAKGAQEIYSQYAGHGGRSLETLGASAWTDDFLILYIRGDFFCRCMPDASYYADTEPAMDEMAELCRIMDRELIKKSGGVETPPD